MHNISLGSVYNYIKNGKSLFFCDIHFTDEHGKRKVISTSGSKKRDVVARATKKYEGLICKAERTSESDVTFESYAIHWLYEIYKGSVQPNSWNRVEQAIRLEVIPYLGDMYMSKIRQANVKQMLQYYADMGHSYSALKKYRSAVRMIFQHYRFENDNYNAPNPTEDVKIPATAKATSPKSEICFSPEQLDAIAEAAITTDSKGNPLFRMGYAFIFMMFTGLRPSEMLGLCWSDVAKDFSHIEINHVAVLDGNKTILKEGTKSKRSQRIITLCEPAKFALKQLHTITEGHLTVTSTQKHTLLAYCDFNRTFHSVLKHAGIKLKPGTRIGPHSFRHNFATNMAKNGVSPEVTASILGHSSVVCTMNHYIHPDNKRKLEAMEELASYVSITLPKEDDDFNESDHMYFDDSVE